MMQLSYLIMGMFLDDTAMLVIVAPLYVPLVIALGFDPIWYGVLYTILAIYNRQADAPTRAR
jgi:TRAP-type C4-dicarboxylate transport system permease large subunit